MKVFLSYGHDDNEALVQRIMADLEKEGHDVWIDRCEIKGGDDWRRAITDGILGSRAMLACLSRRSTRDPGVCLKEIAVALNVGNVFIATLLLEDESQVQPPPGVSHIQWLDLHEWKAKQNSPEWAEWYAGRLKEILRILQDDATHRFAGEIERLRAHLKPLTCEAEIAAHVPDFQERPWVVKAYEDWLAGERDRRVFWIRGAPGSGKTALAANLACRQRSVVLGAHFCKYKSPDHRDARRLVRSLAFQLAARLPHYRRSLLFLPEIDQLDGKNADDLFAYLIAEPLQATVHGNERLVLLIDALDEAEEDIVNLLSREVGKLPNWIGLVVTSRPEADIVRKLSDPRHFAVLTLGEHAAENETDLRRYFESHLDPRITAPERTPLINTLITKSAGNFLYARFAAETVNRGDLRDPDPATWPEGLEGMYFHLFERQFPDRAAYAKHQYPLLELAAAAFAPLPLKWAGELLDWRGRDRIEATEPLGSLFPIEGDCLTACHRSLLDWLADPTRSGYYAVNVAEGHEKLAQALWQEYLEDGDNFLDRHAYAPHLAQHLHWLAGIEWPTLARMLGEDMPAAATRVAELAKSLGNRFLWDSTLAARRVVVAIREKVLGPEHLDTATSLNNLAFLLKAQGDYPGAEPLYRRGLMIREKVLGPEHRDTAMSLNNLALLLQAKGDYPGAEPLYRRALVINEKILGPEHPDTARSLNNLGCFLQDQGDRCSAEPLHRRALATFEKILGLEHPDTAVSLSSMAFLLQAKGDYPGAEPLYQRALAIREKVLGPEHPDTARSLSNLAALRNSMGDYPGAEPLCRRALAIREKVLGPEHPDTATSLNNLGYILEAQGDRRSAELLCRQALAIHEKVLGPEHPDTATSLHNLAYLLSGMGNYPGAEPLYQRALAIREKILGPEHPDTATSIHNLASLLDSMGDYPGVEPLYRRALTIREKVLGPEHPGTATSLNNLASLHKVMGDYPGAEPLLRSSLAIFEKVLGKDHPNTARVRENLQGVRRKIEEGSAS